jgi:hypothetical protein
MHLSRTDKTSYAPATLASDISRIVDPTYSFTRPSPSTASPKMTSFDLQPKVYVDHAGDMHDPDYRDFPVLPARTARRSSLPGLQPLGLAVPMRDYSYDSGLDDRDGSGSSSAPWARRAASYSTLTSSPQSLPRSRAESTTSLDGYFGPNYNQLYPAQRWASFESPRFEDPESRGFKDTSR